MVVGWRLGFDFASLVLGDTSVMTVHLAKDPVERTVLQELVKLGGNVPQEVAYFIFNKPPLPVLITMG